MRRFAFIVATENYSTEIDPTPFCHDDARLLKATLLEYCDFAEQDIMLELLTLELPSSPLELLSKIEEMVRKSEQGDIIANLKEQK